MDQRLRLQSAPSPASGSPFNHRVLYDFSGQYKLQERCTSSSYYGGSLVSDDQDDSVWFGNHLQAVRDANEDASISGQFTLDRLWLDDGNGSPDFAVGDSIEAIAGRQYNLSASFNSQTIYPEIIQIIYLPDKQKTKLITRDLRYAEVVL